VSFTEQIWIDVDWSDYARKIGDTTESATLDAHRDLERLRLAVVLATLDGRIGNVTDDDYEMAQQWSSASAALRDYTLQWWNESQALDKRNEASTRGELLDVTGASKHAATVQRVARKIANCDHIKGTTYEQPWPCPGSWLGRDAPVKTEAIAYGVAHGLFKARGMAVYVIDVDMSTLIVELLHR
jgi:hypothetical protein